MSTKDNKIWTNKKTLRDYLMQYRLLVVAFLIAVLLYLSFIGGQYYACDGGYMFKGKCVAPNKELLQVCEYDNTCFATCSMVIIQDKQAYLNKKGVN